MKKLFIWILVLVCVCSSFALGTRNVSAVTSVAPSSELVLEVGRYRYYKTGTIGKDYKLVSQKIGSKTKTTLTKKEVQKFYVQGQYVYYLVRNEKTSKHSIYRVRRDGKNEKCLVTAYQLKMIGIQGNYVYYCYYKKYSNVIVGRIQLNGDSSTKKNIYTTNTNYYNFNPVLTNQRIYFTNNKRTIIYSLTLGGKKLDKLVTGTSVRSLTAGQDGLYYLCDQNDGTIKGSTTSVMKVDFDGTVTTLDYFDLARVSDYRIATDGEPATDYTSFQVHLEQVTKDSVYYSLTDLQYISYLFETATDGSMSKIIFNESDYHDSDWMYGISGFTKGKDFQLVSFAGEEEPKIWIYKDGRGSYQLNISPNEIQMMDGTVYYQITKSKKKVYQRCKITDLLVK